VWDGQWFKRAFFDNGQALGAQANEEAKIDLIAQAWSVLSGVASPARQLQAMASVDAHLVDHELGLIRLLTPPFAHADPSPGYIQAYPPGVRENGGQYAHAGVWAVMAAARLAGQAPASEAGTELWQNRAFHYFTCLSPAHRASHPTWRLSYGLEPYVMAGDVYSEAPWAGRGGWSWYTGSAAWMHRAAIESIFGLSLHGVVQGPKQLSLSPCLPTHWPRAEMVLQREGKRMRFILIRATPAHALAMALAPTGEGSGAPMAKAETLSGARLLRPAQVIDWGQLPAESCFVVPLLQAP
jgi:cyclic beta-1,2-glucan synthetase